MTEQTNAKTKKEIKEVKLKRYYDACALRIGRETTDEIRGFFQKGGIILVSQLALGEAFGKCLNKGKDKAEAFADLMSKIEKFITIVDNNIPLSLLSDLSAICGRIHTTDLVHLASAVKYKCRDLRTADKDLYNLTKHKVQFIGKKYEILNFTITEVKWKE